jgi:hypothetical protein
MRTYYAFCDPSGGSSDSMTMAIAHRSILKDAVLDGYWERRPPFSPDDVVREFAEVLESYRITVVVGDRYAGAWVAERFREHRVAYRPSEKTKSEIYVEFVALLNSRRVRIPRDRRLRQQFASLERRASRSGKDIVDHPLSGHDDAANSVAGVLVLAAARPVRKLFMPAVLDVRLNQPPPPPEPGAPWVDPYAALGPMDSGPERWWRKN